MVIQKKEDFSYPMVQGINTKIGGKYSLYLKTTIRHQNMEF